MTRPSGQRGVVENLDGGEEGVQVDVHDGAGVDLAPDVRAGAARSTVTGQPPSRSRRKPSA